MVRSQSQLSERWLMLQKTFRAFALAGVLLSWSTVFAKPAGNEVAFPTGFRDWFVVNSMIVTKDSPMFGQIGGMHIIYVNAKALPTLKKGGPFPYPDGAVFADDVHEFSVKDGSYVEGNKKAVTVMVKDATKYASTGGWGFQVWAGGIQRNRWSPIPRQPVLRAIRREEPMTSRFRPTFPEIDMRML
jgi:hypothetical protein